MNISPCKKCGSMPELVVPQMRSIHPLDSDHILIGPGPDSEKMQHQIFTYENPPYLKCRNCEQLAAAQKYQDAILKWNEEQS